MLTASDGSTVTGGPLVPLEAFATVSESLFGYSSSVSGLKAGTTYDVTFSSLTASTGGCRYGAENAGSFSTN